MSQNTQLKVFNAEDPVWIDDVWVDTVVVVGLTAFILCLMGLSKVCTILAYVNTSPPIGRIIAQYVGSSSMDRAKC